jgi:hypothetical protein
VDAELKLPRKPEKGYRRSERELIEEILQLSRASSLLADRSSRPQRINPDAISDILEALRLISSAIKPSQLDRNVIRAMETLRNPLEYLMQKTDISRNQMNKWEITLDELFAGIRRRRIPRELSSQEELVEKHELSEIEDEER